MEKQFAHWGLMSRPHERTMATNSVELQTLEKPLKAAKNSYDNSENNTSQKCYTGYSNKTNDIDWKQTPRRVSQRVKTIWVPWTIIETRQPWPKKAHTRLPVDST